MGLDARLADVVTGAIAIQALELLWRDLTRVTEDLRSERRVLVVTEVDLDDLDAGELGLMLVQIVDLLLANGRLDGDGCERIEPPFVDLARESLGRDVQNAGEALDELESALLRQGAHPELNRRACDVGDDDAATPVEDRPSGRLDTHEAKLIVLRRVQMLVAREHLERPETQEEDGERDQPDDAENGDAQSKLRCEPMWLANSRVGRQEAPRGSSALLVGVGAHLTP